MGNKTPLPPAHVFTTLTTSTTLLPTSPKLRTQLCRCAVVENKSHHDIIICCGCDRRREEFEDDIYGGLLIIGDEVLGGKTVDTNSAYMAKFCFQLGMALKRIEVIADDEDEIVEAVKRMSTNYDFVVTSGGIGPTHDDITYQSIAKAFSLPLILHDE